MNYIIALGKGIEILEDGEIELRLETKLTALAAVVLLEKGFGDKIIFSGGHTKGKYRVSEAEAMLNFAGKYSIFVTRRNVILESNSVDTAANAEEVAKIIDGNSRTNLITTKLHLIRAKKLFKNYEIKIDRSFAAEDILKKESPRFDFVLRQYNLKRKLREFGWETICLIFATTIDRKGKILRFFTKRREA